MSIEQKIIERINGISSKKICIIGNMDEGFYDIISENITEKDSLYLFNTLTNIENINYNINRLCYCKINIIPFIVTNKNFDWYGWHLLKYYHQLKKLNVDPKIFTAVFYRGKHLFQYDMGVLPIVMKMISDGGFLTVYDCSWSLEKSPTMKPEVNNKTITDYTLEQIKLPHMQYLLDTFIDQYFLEQKDLSSNKIRVYCKNLSATSSSMQEQYY